MWVIIKNGDKQYAPEGTYWTGTRWADFQQSKSYADAERKAARLPRSG